MISRKIATESISERRGVVGESGHDDRELARLTDEARLLIMQDTLIRQRQRLLGGMPRRLLT